MQLDPDHVKVLAQALSTDETGKEFVNFDIEFMLTALFRLNPWERGLLTQVLFEAAIANPKTNAQRAKKSFKN